MADAVSSAELAVLMNSPPEAAVKFFEAKGLALTWNWHDQWQDAHSQAFTVAKLARLDILQDIRDGVQRALDSGESEAAFKKRMGALLQQKGWWGKKIVVGSDGQAEVVQEGSPRRLSTIYRTNLQSAYMAGRWQQFAAEADEAPFIQYIAVMDGRTRPGHAKFNGKVFKITDPAWQVIAPPNGFNCRCRLRNLDARELAERGLKVESDAQIEHLPHEPLQDARTGKWIGDTGVQRGVSVPDPAYPGKRQTLWADRGWDYNPGAAGLEHLKAIEARKLAAAAPEIRAAAENHGISKSFDFTGQRPGLSSLPPVRVTELSGDEFGAGLGKVELAKRADALLRKLQVGGGLPNDDTGWIFGINRKGRGKMGDNPDLTVEESKAVAGIEALARRAVVAESHPDDTHKNEFVRAIYRLYAPLAIDGVLYRVKLTAKDFTTAGSPKILHALEVAEIENAPLGTFPASTAKTVLQQGQPTTERTLNIADLLSGAKMNDGNPYEL